MAKGNSKNNKSEIFIMILGIIVIVLAIIFIKKPQTTITTESPVKEEVKNTSTPISITDQDIKEANFTGTKSVIVGSGDLADAARAFIDSEVKTFKQSADTDVPDMRAKFGADNPTAKYEIDLKATDVKSSKTESIIITEYLYTGGANGNDLYKVFTASNETGKILSLSDVILPAKQSAFTAYIKKQLNDWRPEGSTDPVVFPEDVSALTFDSFTNWSYDDKNLIIYFDKFSIGPGVLGSTAFPLPLSKIKSFLVTPY